MKRRKKVKQQHSLQHLRTRAWRLQLGLCYWCKRPIALKAATADHLVPVYAGGKTWPGNIVAACAPCNNLRNSETNRLPQTATVIVATAGDDTLTSPFAKLKGVISCK
jgi:5-methylcytosine-specific restriction endonuclease McrA